MANGSSNNNWERIQLGIKSVQRLIGQKDYNSAMVKARQTLEFMVRMLAERSGSMSDSDLKEMIDMLYRNRRITKTSCDRYHKIRMIGNKAAHEGDNSPSNDKYDNWIENIYDGPVLVIDKDVDDFVRDPSIIDRICERLEAFGDHNDTQQA